MRLEQLLQHLVVAVLQERAGEAAQRRW
jgi:hypothetical protein